MVKKSIILLKVTIGLSHLILSTFSSAQPEIQWWYDLDAPSFGSAAVDDIDNDGFPEIVFGTYFNDERIIALNAEDGTLLWSYFTDGCNDASPVIFDVDLDGDLEVIAPASSPYAVYCFDGATGNIEWQTSTGFPNCIDSPPAVADLDNDDLPEIVFGAFYGNVFCLNGEDGSFCWQINLGSNSYIQSEPDILDCDSDGQLDVVVAQWDGDCRIYALKGNDGSVLWYNDQPDDWMYHGGSFADIDEDGRPEIAIGCYDGDVYVLNAEDGRLLWEYTGLLYVGAPTSIADLDNDGHLEIVFAAYNSLKVLSNTGTILWSYGTGGSIFRGAAISDTDGDGVLDVVFGADDGILRSLRGTDGSVNWSMDLERHYGRTFNIDHAPVIADFNNDDSLDVFIIGGHGASGTPTENHGRAYAVTAGGGTGPGWPMFRHDPRHSGCFGESDSPIMITVTPLNPPVIVPEQGGNIDFDIYMENRSGIAQNFDAWLDISYQGGAPLTVVQRSFTNFQPGWMIQRPGMYYPIPGNYPAGDYTFYGKVGDHPDIVWDQSGFVFIKEGLANIDVFTPTLSEIDYPDPFSLDRLTNGEIASPERFECSAYPNPLNPSTTIRFSLPESGKVELSVFDIQGRKVAELVNGWRQVGNYEVKFDGSGLASGIYFYKIKASDFVSMQKLALVK